MLSAKFSQRVKSAKVAPKLACEQAPGLEEHNGAKQRFAGYPKTSSNRAQKRALGKGIWKQVKTHFFHWIALKSVRKHEI